jgi:uracil-DNA glycosylase
MSEWLDHVTRWRDCTKCSLCEQRSNIVLARGVLPCDVLFVGEAPGASEDALGLPFVGPAGLLLDNPTDENHPGIVQAAKMREVGLRLAFTNLVCCFPREAKDRGENEPEHEEIMACRPRLEEFIKIANPRLVIRVGRLAWDYVEHNAYGKIGNARVVDIVHPAAVFRMPLARKQMAIQRAIVQIRHAVEDLLQ